MSSCCPTVLAAHLLAMAAQPDLDPVQSHQGDLLVHRHAVPRSQDKPSQPTIDEGLVKVFLNMASISLKY